MDALVMCGGRGTRLDADVEKPLFHVAGVPMIDRVVAALADSRIDGVTAVTSPVTPHTRDHLDAGSVDAAISTIAAPGEGYVADLQYALDSVDSPVLTVAADLPLLAGAAVDDVLDRYESEVDRASLNVCVPASLKRRLGASVDTTVEAAVGASVESTTETAAESRADGQPRTLAPTGVNVVGSGDGESIMVSWDARLAVNVNHKSDAELAEELL